MPFNLWDRIAPRNTYQRQPLPTIAEASDDGEKMAIQAALMALKNRILIQAITTKDTVRSTQLLAPAREIFAELIHESRSDQERIARNLDTAKKKRGLAEGGTDYRRGDVANLTLRLNAGIEVERRLNELSADTEAMLAFVGRAHELAWDEISKEMERSLNRRVALHIEDANYAVERDARVTELIETDLARLRAKSDEH
jgi:hypothetical protein